MSGRLEIDSSPGKGTRIMVIAPQPPTPQSQPHAPTERVQPEGQGEKVKADKIRIVLADDHHR